MDKYSTVFVGEGKLRDQQIKLHIRTDVHPVMQPQRQIPYHMRKEVSKELEKLVKQDIIEKVVDNPHHGSRQWSVHPKKTGEYVYV